jgi:F-type H+-transporting ATPase subunit b
MRLPRFLLAAALAVVPAFALQHEPAAAQPGEAPKHAESHEAKGHGESKGHGQEHGNLEIWKWANFLLLAGGLGYLIGKNAGPFFASRSRQISKDMADSDSMRRDAEARAADVERRLANLQAEIDAIRLESSQQQAADADRLRHQTTADIAKLQQQAEQEIASAGKGARSELKRYAAGLALELAERRIRSGITPDAQDALVKGFVQDLGRTS